MVLTVTVEGARSDSGTRPLRGDGVESDGDGRTDPVSTHRAGERRFGRRNRRVSRVVPGRWSG